MRLAHTLITLAVASSFGCAAAAGPLEDAEAAFLSGDYVTALRGVLPLAEQGNSHAQFYLGLIYERGFGVPEDYVEAAHWYRQAADQKDSAAQNNLGLMYFDGRGVPQDNVRAYMWYNLAAAQGDRDAMANRSSIVRLMTNEQIADAQKMDREWVEHTRHDKAINLSKR
jgi:TPR repeat protein